MEHFTINGTLFLAFVNNRGDITKHKTSSMIYKMKESTGRFTLYETLQTRDALGVEYFSIAERHFLAVAYHWEGTYQLESVIFQWNGKLFDVFQKIPAKGASHLTFFTINGDISTWQWQITMMEAPIPQNQSSTNGTAASLTRFRR